MTCLCRLYLDVDGVINASRPDPAWRKTATASVPFERDSPQNPTTFEITWAPALVTALNGLRDEFDVELVWLSTWNERANVTANLVPVPGGLRDGRMIPYSPQSRPAMEANGWWKARAIIADQIRSPTPFIWMDDVEVELHGWKILSATRGTSSLMIPTNVMTGLRRDEIERARDWLSGLEPSGHLMIGEMGGQRGDAKTRNSNLPSQEQCR
jgi:hypothetical protein